MIYRPDNYQLYATDFIEAHPVSCLLLDMGLGKTAITLTAICDLLFDSFQAHKVLVVAPLRVARDTWPEELRKWDHLAGLRFSVAVGSEAERRAALLKKADIHIINRENVQWLIEESGLPFDYDTVVVDELSSFKSHQSKRFRSLMRVRPKVKRIVGLTGTPSSNGLMDLWAEFRLLDMGLRLGRFIGRYRTDYFIPDKRNGQVIFSYKPLPDAERRIYAKIADINTAKAMVEQNRDLLALSKLIPSTKRIVFGHTNSFYRVLSSETKSKQGFNVSGLIFDELFAQQTRDLFDTMTKYTGDARRQPLYFLITTAGRDKTSICYEIHCKAQAVLDGSKVGPSFYPAVFGIEEDDDWTDERVWRRVNPSIGVTIPLETVRAAFEQASQNPAEEMPFRQFRLNE